MSQFSFATDATPAPDIRLARAAWQCLVVGVLGLALLQAIGTDAARADGRIWLVLAPLAALAAVHRHRLLAGLSRQLPLASDASAHPRDVRQAGIVLAFRLPDSGADRGGVARSQPGHGPAGRPAPRQRHEQHRPLPVAGRRHR